MPSIGAQDAMFDVIATYALTADSVTGLAEKGYPSAAFHDTVLDSQCDHSVQHKRIVEIDPKCQPRILIRQSGWIEGAQFCSAVPKIIVEWISVQGGIIHVLTMICQPTG
jgi:hypothetical protein